MEEETSADLDKSLFALRSPKAPRRDAYGFPVKPEYEELYAIHSQKWEEDEEERGERWRAFLQELSAGLPPAASTAAPTGTKHVAPKPEDDAALLERALSDPAASTGNGGTGAVCQRLRALVHAGVPMSRRGTFWKLFLGVEAKRRPGEYQELVAKAFEVEGTAAAGRAAPTQRTPAAVRPAGSTKPAKGSWYHIDGLASLQLPVVEIRVDARTGPGAAAAPGPPPSPPTQCDVFQLIPLHDSPIRPSTQGVWPADSASASGGASSSSSGVLSLGLCTLPECVEQECCTPASSLVPPPPSVTTGRYSSAGSAGSEWSPEAWRSCDYLGQIDKDLHRTFPNHPSMDASGRAMLRRILAAFARRNARVGYCQGLNFIAATFALFMPEEDAFWCLAAVVEDLLPGYFDARMVAPQVDQLVLSHLLEGGFPTVWRHMHDLEVDPSSAMLHWFICIFLNSLPLETCLRVWDVLFFEGSAVVLFRVALALVDTYSQALLATRESSDAFMLLQSLAPMSFDASGLINAACIGFGHIKDVALQCLRHKYRGEVLQTMRPSLASDEEYRQLCEQHQDGCGEQRILRSRGLMCGEGWEWRMRHDGAADARQGRPGGGSRPGSASPADSGHLTDSGVASSRSSNRSGAIESSSTASTPLARVKQAVGALSARLVPSSLPVLLPSGAVGTMGQELQPAAAAQPGSTLHVQGGVMVASTQRDARPESSVLVHNLQSISVARPLDAPPSPMTEQLQRSTSLAAGAALARQAPPLTPFSAEEAVVAAAARGSQLPCASNSGRPAGYVPPSSSSSSSSPELQGEGSSTVPATPASRLPLGVAPTPPTHRRAQSAMMAGYGSHLRSRRRRPINVNISQLLEFRPDLTNAAVAAAFKIAARASPGGRRLGASMEHEAGVPALTAAVQSAARAIACNRAGVVEGLPIRTLSFEHDDADGCQPGSAPAGPAAAGSSPFQQAWGDVAGEPHPRRFTEGDAGDFVLQPDTDTDHKGADAAGWNSVVPAPTGTPEQPRLQPSATSAQQEQQLLEVVAQLQAALAFGESRRHEAESLAAEARDTRRAMQRQLAKIVADVRSKEAAASLLQATLSSGAPALTELEGELAAKRMAVEVQQRQLESKRRQLQDSEQLVRTLMDTAAQLAAAQPGRVGGRSRSFSLLRAPAL